MIIARSPLRVSLGGGGTDLASYYGEYGGFLIAGAINKYVYVTVMRPFTEGIFLKYSELEHVERVEDVRHPIIREALKLQNLHTPQIEITTLADIPGRHGPGLFQLFHYRPAQGAARAPPQHGSAGRPGRTGLPY